LDIYKKNEGFGWGKEKTKLRGKGGIEAIVSLKTGLYL